MMQRSNRAPQHPKGTRVAFTLIELLVVIAIISILAAILFPVFARARDKARQASCQSNLKQLALGILMYYQDYDEAGLSEYRDNGVAPTYTYPGDTTWQRAIEPYVKNHQVYTCPSTTIGLSLDSTRSAYGLAGGAIGRGPAEVKIPAETILLGESQYPDSSGNPTGYHVIKPAAADPFTGKPDRANWTGLNFYTAGSEDRYPAIYRHSEMGVFAFCDGHVKTMRKEVAERKVTHEDGVGPLTHQYMGGATNPFYYWNNP